MSSLVVVGICSLTSHVGYALSQWWLVLIYDRQSGYFKNWNKTDFRQTRLHVNRFVSFEVAAILRTAVKTTSRVVGETTYSPIVESKSTIIYTTKCNNTLIVNGSYIVISVTKAEISPHFYKSMDMSVGAWHQQQLMTNLINDCHLQRLQRMNHIVSFEVSTIQRAAAPGHHRW